MRVGVKNIVCLLCVFTLCKWIIPNYVWGQVVLNEIYIDPLGGVQTNSFLITAPCGPDNRAMEWVEFFNQSPCDTIDVGCYIIGSHMHTFTDGGTQLCAQADGTTVYGADEGYLTLPPGTKIPPYGFLVVGSDDPAVQIRARDYLPIGSTYYCGSPRYFLNSRSGWIGLFKPDGAVVDAAFWVESDPNDIFTNQEFITSGETNCTCDHTKIRIPSARELSQQGKIKLVGKTSEPGFSQTGQGVFFRSPDGAPCWKSIAAVTPRACNTVCLKAPKPPFLSPKTQKLCPGQPIQYKVSLYDSTITCPPEAVYQWTSNPPGFTSNVLKPTITATTNRTYILTVNTHGCIVQDSLKVETYALSLPELTANPAKVCPGDTVFVTQNIPLLPHEKAEWNLGGAEFPLIDTASIYTKRLVWKTPGIKQISVKTIGTECSSPPKTLSIEVIGSDAGTLTAAPNAICPEDTIRLNLRVPDGAELVKWSLDGGYIIDNTDPLAPLVTWTQTGFKTVRAETRLPGYDCLPQPDSVRVEIFPRPEPVFRIETPGPGKCFHPRGRFLGDFPKDSTVKFFWQFEKEWYSTNVDTFIFPWGTEGYKTVRFYVVSRGCTSRVAESAAEINYRYAVALSEVPLPTAFSPNGDGLNDIYFIPEFLADCAEHTLTIYDRWGHRVYYGENERAIWDGKFNGNACPESVFVCVVQFILPNKTKIQRVVTVTLIR